ncbi:hypothetical protein ACFO3O_10840 [Dokdonia ponticola]|uniref:Uncharacterized protein n=1 Tax=Dokdonia ponticola TaxID=2041041 RepID=A0ABV9HW63_9FLAO
MKTATCKQLQMKYSVLILLFLCISISCSKTDDGPSGLGDGEVEQINGISADELDNYQGDLGILVNTRDLVKKGYIPAKVDITTTASEGNYDQQIDIDPFTNIGKLSISVEDLTEAAEAELRNGVGLTLDILDASNNEITSETYSLTSFEENGNEIDIDASALNYLSQELYFQEGMRYYLQLVSANGSYNTNVVWKPSSAQDNNVVLQRRSSSFNAGTTSEQYHFHKFQGDENTFAIYSANTNRYLATDSNDKTFRQSGAISFPTGLNDNSLHPRYRFIVKKEQNGLYTINDINGNPMREFANNGNISWRAINTGNIQYFRIIALDVAWETQVLDTKHLQPILPAVETSFGFNSTLRNCGAGNLEQEVGVESEVVTTYSTSFQESIGLSGRVTTSVEASVSATAEASFFGNGGSVTGEVSAGVEVSVEASSTTTIGNEQSTSNTTSISSRRTVTVPAGSASLVYDAYQTYSNVKVPYVKRFRLKGTGTNGSGPMSGLDILTQLDMTSFSGTVTTVGSDFVEVTIRGAMILDNIVDTQTEVRDVAANCD